jgi:hypothetical protein
MRHHLDRHQQLVFHQHLQAPHALVPQIEFRGRLELQAREQVSKMVEGNLQVISHPGSYCLTAG